MSSCDESNIKKNYIVQTPTDFDILSACTGFYTNNIYNCTGDTLTLHSTTVSANTINASVYLSGGTNLLDIFGSLDNYTTGATLVGTEVVFDRTNLLSAYTLNLSTLVDNNTFVTGYTYDGANTFTISDNSGSTFNATFNTVTGLTVTGGLSATTLSACTGIYTSNLYGCSPITVNDSLILLSGLTFSSITQDNSLTEILSRDSGTGEVKYRDVESIISAATSQDTFVTGGTFNGLSNELTLERNDSVNIIVSGFSSGSQFGTTYFVAPMGDDSTGEYGNISKPFKTITGARNQLLTDALTGQTLVYVFPGTYDETELQYPNGKMYLSPGSLIKPSAKIEGDGAAMTAVNQGTKTFTFNGNWAIYLSVGKKFRVVGGTNDGTYTIVSSTDVGGSTEVVVSEVIPSASVGGKLRNNETIFTLGSTPLNAPSGSTSNNFDLYGEGDIDVVKSLDDDWSGGIVTAFGSAEFYGEAVTWR